MKANAIVSIVVLVFVISVAARATRDTSTRSYRMPDNSVLKFSVPSDWRDSSAFSQNGTALIINYSTNDPKGFRFRITALPAASLKSPLNTPEQIKDTLHKLGQTMLPASEETSVELKELAVHQGSAFYFTLSDKTVQPGQRKYITQGVVGLEKSSVFFTITALNKDSDDQKAAFNLVGSIRQETLQ